MQALILERQGGKTPTSVQPLNENQPSEGDVTVDIHWSSLNYKDALAITGRGKIIRNFPMIPGIDSTGAVRAGENPRFHTGQEVLPAGQGAGEDHWSGLVERTRVKGDWLVTLPGGLDRRKTMIIDTTGFTTMLCVMALEDAGIRPRDGEIVVTGASGDVGNMAVALPHKLGYQVAAVSGRGSTHGYLKSLDVNRILGRDEFAGSRPLERQLWAGMMDIVGGKVLTKVLAQMNYDGCVATCGPTDDFALPTTVIPFILHDVRLQGMDPVTTPPTRRAETWARLVKGLPESFYAQAATEITLADVPKFADAIINNQM